MALVMLWREGGISCFQSCYF